MHIYSTKNILKDKLGHCETCITPDEVEELAKVLLNKKSGSLRTVIANTLHTDQVISEKPMKSC